MKKFKYAYQVGGLWGDVRTRIPRIAKLGYDAVEAVSYTHLVVVYLAGEASSFTTKSDPVVKELASPAK